MFGVKKTHADIISHFRKSSIFMSNLKRFMVLIAVPLTIINILTAVYYYRSNFLESSMTSNQIFTSTATSLEKIYVKTEEIYLSLAIETAMGLFTSTENYSDLGSYDTRSLNSMTKSAVDFCTASDGISSIDIYSVSADYVLSTVSSGPLRFHTDKSWYQNPSDSLCYSISDGNSLTICYNMFSNKKKIGLVAFNISPSYLSKLGAYSDKKQVSIRIIDDDDRVIYASPDPLPGEPMTIDKSITSNVKVHNKYTEMAKKVYNVYLYMTIEHSQPLYSNFVFILLLFVIIIIVLSTVLAIILASFSYRSVQEIITNVNDSEPMNDFSGAANEIMYINQNIMRMKDKNQKLEEELLSSFASLKVLQTQVLQSQFTPHFLFNALNTLSLSMMLKNGVNNPESKYVISLSDLMYESIDVKNYIISLKNEMEYCRKYIEIQSYISNYNFDVFYDVPDNVESCVYIKFTLQPIIENAFKHGIKNLKNKKKGMLKIVIRRVGETLETCIINNGPSPTAEEMESINQRLSLGVSNDRSHVGLFNVNKRIKLVFGEEYGCSITTEGSLTLVRVITPYLTDFNNDPQNIA